MKDIWDGVEMTDRLPAWFKISGQTLTVIGFLMIAHGVVALIFGLIFLAKLGS